jgi:hypothetical protein
VLFAVPPSPPTAPPLPKADDECSISEPRLLQISTNYTYLEQNIPTVAM